MDAHSSALHEMGHAIVAEHFGQDTEAVIFLRDTQHDDLDLSYTGGFTTNSGLGRTPFRQACIGFAGYAAALIAEHDYDALDVFESFFGEEQSKTDMASVEGHKQQWRACKTACNILTKNKAELIERATKLETKFLANLSPAQRAGEFVVMASVQ